MKSKSSENKVAALMKKYEMVFASIGVGGLVLAVIDFIANGERATLLTCFSLAMMLVGVVFVLFAETSWLSARSVRRQPD